MEKPVTGLVASNWKQSYLALRENRRVFILLMAAYVVVMFPTLLIEGQVAGWVKGASEVGFGCATLYIVCAWCMRGYADVAAKQRVIFVRRFVVLKLLIILPAHLYFLSNLGEIIWTARDVEVVSNGNVAIERSIIWAQVIFSYPMTAFIYLFAFTWLPASLVSHGGGFPRAVKRGRVVFGHNLVWLIAGPLVLKLIFELTSVGLAEFGIGVLVALGGAGESLYRLYLLFFVGAVWGTAKVLCVNIMIGVVISRAFWIGEACLNNDQESE